MPATSRRAGSGRRSFPSNRHRRHCRFGAAIRTRTAKRPMCAPKGHGRESLTVVRHSYSAHLYIICPLYWTPSTATCRLQVAFLCLSYDAPSKANEVNKSRPRLFANGVPRPLHWARSRLSGNPSFPYYSIGLKRLRELTEVGTWLIQILF